jgi:hypothetical protein
MALQAVSSTSCLKFSKMKQSYQLRETFDVILTGPVAASHPVRSGGSLPETTLLL